LVKPSTTTPLALSPSPIPQALYSRHRIYSLTKNALAAGYQIFPGGVFDELMMLVRFGPMRFMNHPLGDSYIATFGLSEGYRNEVESRSSSASRHC
jgi:hypothetical protein